MRVVFDLDLDSRSLMNLRNIMHDLVDVAFNFSRLDINRHSFTEDEASGKEKFSIEIDKDGRQAIFSYMAYENAVIRKQRESKSVDSHETDLRD